MLWFNNIDIKFGFCFVSFSMEVSFEEITSDSYFIEINRKYFMVKMDEVFVMEMKDVNIYLLLADQFPDEKWYLLTFPSIFYIVAKSVWRIDLEIFWEIQGWYSKLWSTFFSIRNKIQIYWILIFLGTKDVNRISSSHNVVPFLPPIYNGFSFPMQSFKFEFNESWLDVIQPQNNWQIVMQWAII